MQYDLKKTQHFKKGCKTTSKKCKMFFKEVLNLSRREKQQKAAWKKCKTTSQKGSITFQRWPQKVTRRPVKEARHKTSTQRGRMTCKWPYRLKKDSRRSWKDLKQPQTNKELPQRHGIHFKKMQDDLERCKTTSKRVITFPKSCNLEEKTTKRCKTNGRGFETILKRRLKFQKYTFRPNDNGHKDMQDDLTIWPNNSRHKATSKRITMT